MKIIERFWAKVKKTDGCWEWTGATNEHGYGKFNLAGTALKAHRLAYELEVGEIPSGMHVLHSCDTPTCVNPAHLWLGTHTDNMRDMFAKGRRIASAEKNNAWKLTADEVRAIRERYRQGGTTYRQLGREFGVASQYVGAIVNLKAWPYVT